MTDTDAVVVGAGHNGLVAANLLADSGWSVTVLEAAPHPGGAVHSEELLNLVGGAINGGGAELFQQLVFRPFPSLSPARTPFASLYLASSSAHPGGGVHGGPGANAARAALHDDRLRPFLRLRHRPRRTHASLR